MFLKTSLYLACIACGLFSFLSMSAQTKELSDDEALLNQFIESRGKNGIIKFDSNNIKQFWIDNSVHKKDNRINILLEPKNQAKKESVPFKIQLANVNETQDCKIDIVSLDPSFSFSILNNAGQVISNSSKDNDFLSYHIVTATIHLEDTTNQTFYVVFHSNDSDQIAINHIVLSFANNKKTTFLASPGKFVFNKDNANIEGAVIQDDNLREVKGNNIQITSKNSILVQDNQLSINAKFKNNGESACRIYIGFEVYTKTGFRLSPRNYPFENNNKILEVLSAEQGSNKIIVDSCPKWAKNCYLVSSAQENLSDVPNTSIISGQIVDVKEVEGGKAEITIARNLGGTIAKGTKLRVHGTHIGGLYLFAGNLLGPGEEKEYTSVIQKDDNSLQFSVNALPKGTYYVRPLIRFVSTDSKEANVSIEAFSVSY